MAPFEYGVDGPKVIVVGVDGSETSLRAGAYAWGLARRGGARLFVVHVAPVASLSTLTPGGASALRETADEIAAEIRRELEAARRAHARALRVRRRAGRPVRRPRPRRRRGPRGRRDRRRVGAGGAPARRVRRGPARPDGTLAGDRGALTGPAGQRLKRPGGPSHGDCREHATTADSSTTTAVPPARLTADVASAASKGPRSTSGRTVSSRTAKPPIHANARTGRAADDSSRCISAVACTVAAIAHSA
ncbi:universal stress protein [Actinomadura madurae]|uniref:universal stress protein n=1 Tax=Actinomadura madurae TaxID=1993 RepID=UPI003FD817F9